MKKYLFIDIETTGLTPSQDRIVEIAVIDETGSCLLSTRFNPNKPYQEIKDALEYNKLDYNTLCLYPALGGATLRLLKCLFDNNIVVAHNVSFDSEFLVQESVRVLGDNIFSDTEYDCSMIKYAALKNIKSGRIKLPNLQLDSIPHSSLSDAQNCRKLWQSPGMPGDKNDEWNW